MLDSLIRSHLADIRQEHLQAGLEDLSVEEKQAFLQQLKQFPKDLLKRQQRQLASPHLSFPAPFSPLTQYTEAGSEKARMKGERLICQGKVGCLLLAGGQGTRLGSNKPKGMTPVSLLKNKSLFQLFAERVKAASKWAGRPLCLAIMTSLLNHEETCQFFEDNQYFGLCKTQIDFFKQSVLPFCDEQGNWMLSYYGKLAVGPDGNGYALKAFAEQGLLDKWSEQGVEYFQVIPVDNPLADPFDAELIGFQSQENADVVLKAVKRMSPDDKMGVVVERDGKISVVEYTELDHKDSSSYNSDGSLTYPIANTGLFSFHISFLKSAQAVSSHLPWHLAQKQADVLIPHHSGAHCQKAPVWKFETFIFDLLADAKRPAVLLYPREYVYAPLKNACGEKSIDTVREALLHFDHHIYRSLFGNAPPYNPFELDPAFYYPTLELKHKCLRSLPTTGYIQPEDLV